MCARTLFTYCKYVLFRIYDTESTDRVFLRHRYGNYREIPTDTDQKIPTRYTTLDFLQENTRGSRNLSQKSRKGWIPKKLASKLRKLELNRTNLMLNSKNTRSDRTVVPDLGVSSGLYVKNKTIRVLLDSGSSGNLLFMKKGSSKCISVVKRVVPQSWGTSNGTLSQTSWATLKSLLWSTLPEKRYAFSRTLSSTARGNKCQCMTS